MLLLIGRGYSGFTRQCAAKKHANQLSNARTVTERPYIWHDALPSSNATRGFMRFLVILAAFMMALPASAAEIPQGYERQELPPLGGEILKPTEWFYRHQQTGSGWLWTISKEDPALGPFETGWTGQTIVGVEKGTKQPREAFVAGVIRQKSEGRKVVKSCAPTDQGTMYRQCLEVIEVQQRPNGAETFHVSYSFFWGKDAFDVVVMTIFGTPEAQWPAMSPIMEKMAEFKFMGADAIQRLQRQAQ